MTVMGRGSGAVVKNVSLRTDTPGTDAGAISNASAIVPGMRTYSISLDDVRTRIENVPDVERVAVRRQSNGNISVHVKMRRAVAFWTDGEKFFPLTADGTIINQPSEEHPKLGILFRGNLPDDITKITKIATGSGLGPDFMEWVEGRRWNMVIGDITVQLPEDSVADAVSLLAEMEKKYGLLSREIFVIDMRDKGRTLVR